jgi:hypothetical protein
VTQELKDPQVETVVPKVVEDHKVLHQKVILEDKDHKVTKVSEDNKDRVVTYILYQHSQMLLKDQQDKEDQQDRMVHLKDQKDMQDHKVLKDRKV